MPPIYTPALLAAREKIAAAFGLQVFLGEGMKLGRAALAFAAPLLLGAATSLALELSGLTLPPLFGSGIGLFVSFALVTPLVWTCDKAAFGAKDDRSFGRVPAAPFRRDSRAARADVRARIYHTSRLRVAAERWLTWVIYVKGELI